MTEESLVDQIISGIIQAEGGYVDHPHDLGGPTKYGITEQVAREHGYTGDMRELSVTTAREIYINRYYVAPGFNQVARRSEALAAEMTDTGVNMGVDWPTRFLQTALAVFNRQGELYPDISIDGVMGPQTLSALDAFIRHRGDEGIEVLLAAIDHLQGARYIELARQREANESFVYGWIKERTRV